MHQAVLSCQGVALSDPAGRVSAATAGLFRLPQPQPQQPLFVLRLATADLNGGKTKSRLLCFAHRAAQSRCGSPCPGGWPFTLRVLGLGMVMPLQADLDDAMPAGRPRASVAFSYAGPRTKCRETSCAERSGVSRLMTPCSNYRQWYVYKRPGS